MHSLRIICLVIRSKIMEKKAELHCFLDSNSYFLFSKQQIVEKFGRLSFRMDV